MNAVTEPLAAPAATTRFVDYGDGTVTDTTTGLMWSTATLTDSEVDHAQAEKVCAELDLAGHTGWVHWRDFTDATDPGAVGRGCGEMIEGGAQRNA